jgi:hypothetical protein
MDSVTLQWREAEDAGVARTGGLLGGSYHVAAHPLMSYLTR